MKFIKNLTKQREFTIAAVLVVICVVMSIVSPVFTNEGNIKSLLMSVSTEAIMAIAMTNLMVSGGIDMSVGSVMGFSGVCCGMLIKAGVPLVPAILIGLLVGAIAGFLNGVTITKVGITPFITTLASLNIYRSLTYVFTNGIHQSNLGDAFNAIGQDRLLGIQMPIYYTLILVIIGDIILRNSKFFRQNFYIGNNAKAARVSGINVDFMLIFNYALMGLSAALAGIIMASRVGSASVTAGTGMELRVITAAIIGGASMSGGEGSVIGAFFGSLLMALIMNVLTLLSVNVNWQQFVTGATLLAAVVIDTLNSRNTQNQLRKRSNRAVVGGHGEAA